MEKLSGEAIDGIWSNQENDIKSPEPEASSGIDFAKERT